MKYIFLLLPILCLAQMDDPAYADFQEIESIEEYKESKKFYVVNLEMVASDPGMATLSWKAHTSLTKFMVELRDPDTGDLFYRKLHRSNTIEIPASAQATVIPIHLNLKGKPKTTSLAATLAKANLARRKEFEKVLKELQQNNYNNSDSYQKNNNEIPWRWIFRGIGLLALIIGLIARFAGKNTEFKDYDRRDRRR